MTCSAPPRVSGPNRACGQRENAAPVRPSCAYDDICRAADRLAELLQIFNDDPLDDGDAVLLLDDKVCLELEQLATEWDHVLRSNTADLPRSTATRVLVLIPWPGGVLRHDDYQLWRDLHADLRGTDVQLLSVRGMQAA